MAFKFPYSNLHELNLDWILEKVKKFAELIPPMESATEDVQTALETAQQAVADAQDAIDTASQAVSDAEDAIATAEEAKEIAEQAAQGVIADGAVTTAKINNGAVTTQKIADNAVTMQKIDNSVLGMISHVVEGNTAPAGGLTTGEFVLIKNSSITGINDGLYLVAADVAAGDTITSTDLQSQPDGLNYLKNILNSFKNCNSLGNFSSLSELGILLDNALAAQSFNTIQSVSVTCSSPVAPFSTTAYKGVLFISGNNANYASILLLPVANLSPVICLRDVLGWHYYAIYAENDGNAVISNVATDGMHFHITSAAFHKWGKVVQIEIGGSATAEIAIGEVLATLTSNLRSDIAVNFVDNGGRVQTIIGSTGEIKCFMSAIASGTSVSMRATYLVP